MAKIYRYQKISDAYTTYQAQGTEEEPVIELCTLDGTTYVSGPDDLPPQPEQITITPAELTDDLKERIKAASPHCQLIYQRMQEKIRERYCSEDEMYLTRITVGQMAGMYEMEPHEPAMVAEYQAFIENVRQWGRAERAKLGL